MPSSSGYSTPVRSTGRARYLSPPSTGSTFRNFLNVATRSPMLRGVAKRFANRSINRSLAGTPRKASPKWPIKHAQRVAFRKGKKRLKPITSSRLKGVSKKFKANVQKVLDYNEVFGEYIWTSTCQLRQVTKDRWAYYGGDKKGLSIDLWNPFQIWNDYSVLFNSKVNPLNGNWLNDVTEGYLHNVSYKAKIHVVHCYATFYLKSTSNHVCNVEMFECTPKIDTSQPATHYVDQSYLNMFTQNTLSTGTIGGAASDLNSRASHWIELTKNYHVKVHKVKLLPGESTSIVISGFKNRTLDGSKLTNGGAFLNYSKMYPNKNIFFRIMNDITVAGTTGAISSFPSNEQGGVAVRFTRSIRFRPDGNLHSAGVDQKNTIYMTDMSTTSGADVDQQVCYQNPISLSAVI